MKALVLLFLAIGFVACKSQKVSEGSYHFTDEKNKITYSVTPGVADRIPEESQLNFVIRKTSWTGNDLEVDVKYGGGCKVHEFKLIYVKPDPDTLKLYLLHLTTDDLCKAFVLNDLKFDLSTITKLVSKEQILTLNGKILKRED